MGVATAGEVVALGKIVTAGTAAKLLTSAAKDVNHMLVDAKEAPVPKKGEFRIYVTVSNKTEHALSFSRHDVQNASFRAPPMIPAQGEGYLLLWCENEQALTGSIWYKHDGGELCLMKFQQGRLEVGDAVKSDGRRGTDKEGSFVAYDALFC